MLVIFNYKPPTTNALTQQPIHFWLSSTDYHTSSAAFCKHPRKVLNSTATCLKLATHVALGWMHTCTKNQSFQWASFCHLLETVETTTKQSAGSQSVITRRSTKNITVGTATWLIGHKQKYNYIFTVGIYITSSEPFLSTK